MVFILSAVVYMACALFYIIFGSGERQVWDNPDKDEEQKKESKDPEAGIKSLNETQH